MGLDRYKKKRNPAQTNEPFDALGAARPSADGTWAGRFVIHQHAARRMHYDIRLPIGGVLRSFAVPNGPTLDSTIKRLAMETEDHPLDYLDFEDVIPEGNYGAGAMIVWDTGGVTYMETTAEDGVTRGKIDFVLSGSKLQGRFALIATGRRKEATGLSGTKGKSAEWLLIKKPDSHEKPGDDVTERLPRSVLSGMTVEELARRDELALALLDFAVARGAKETALDGPSGFAPPMVCESAEHLVDDARALYELKFDGVRILAEKHAHQTSLWYRSGRAAAANYADVARAVRALPLDHVVLDGEIVSFDEQGRPSFFRLAPRIQARRADDRKRARLEIPVAYAVFDVLEAGHGKRRVDLRSLPLAKRKEVLARLIQGRGMLLPVDHLSTHGSALFALAESQGLEGVVEKRADSTYVHGPRATGHWKKFKLASDADFVVVGWLPGKNGPSLGSLAVASFDGAHFVYRGRVGSGLTHTQAKELERSLHAIALAESDVRGLSEAEVDGLTAVRPELVVRVRHQGYSEGGHLRAPVYEGVRADVSPEECRSAPEDEEALASVDAASQEASDVERRPSTSLSFVTNREKVYFPDDGYTKGDLIDYYVAVAKVMLPFLRGRPVVLVRYPDGIAGKNFYQWRAPEDLPSEMRTLELWDEEKQETRGGTKSAFLVDDAEGLAFIANLGCIPLHVLASRESSPTHCDFITIDFDLGERPLSDAIVLAHDLRQLLAELGLAGYVKTSGQRGLHVLVPLGPGVGFESAKLLTELIGRVLVGRHPRVATMERRKDRRGDKLYVDTGQTGRSRTIVSPYSVRAVAGATVSTPLSWDELHLALDPAIFDIETVVRRLERVESPLGDFFDQRPDLSVTLARLASWTGRG